MYSALEALQTTAQKRFIALDIRMPESADCTLDRQITSEKVKFHNIISLFFCITGPDEFIFGIPAGRNSPLLALLWHAPTMAAWMNVYRLSK